LGAPSPKSTVASALSAVPAVAITVPRPKVSWVTRSPTASGTIATGARVLPVGRGGGAEGPQALLGLLGDNGPLQVTTKGKLAPAFDYAEELAAAQKAFAEIVQQLGEAAPVPTPGIQESQPMTNVRILGVKIVREADSDRELHPMGQNYASLSLCVAGDLPGPALSLDEGRIDSIVTDDGTNLTPEDEWKRRISFPKLTKDRTTAFFDIELPATSDPCGFREIRGALAASVASGSFDVDLGFEHLEPGAKGGQLDAELQRIEPSGENETTIDLHISVSQENVQGFALLDAAGNALESRQSGYSSSSNECTLTYTVVGEWPRDGKIVLRIVTEVGRYSVPWLIENVDVLGRPRGGAAPEKPEKKAKKGAKKSRGGAGRRRPGGRRASAAARRSPARRVKVRTAKAPVFPPGYPAGGEVAPLE